MMSSMPSFYDHVDDGYAECAVCRSDTRLLCSPCGDPVCQNCKCPNGCESALAAGSGTLPARQVVFDVTSEAA